MHPDEAHNLICNLLGGFRFDAHNGPLSQPAPSPAHAWLWLLLFWLTSFGLLMGHLPGVLLLGTAFAIVRAVVVYLYCRRVISTFRMSVCFFCWGECTGSRGYLSPSYRGGPD